MNGGDAPIGASTDLSGQEVGHKCALQLDGLVAPAIAAAVRGRLWTIRELAETTHAQRQESARRLCATHYGCRVAEPGSVRAKNPTATDANSDSPVGRGRVEVLPIPFRNLGT